MPVIGYLSARSPEDTTHLVEAFRRGLSEAGFVEGQNVTIEYRWALGQHDRLPGLAADLVRKPVTVLVSTGGESAALAAKAATSTIPIAFIIGGDPVKLGLAATYSRPGGNATGISILTATLEPKRLELLRELVPQASTIGAFLDPNFPPYEGQLRDVREAARALDLQVQELRVSTDAEIDLAFETVARQRIAAVSVAAGPFFDTRRDKLVTLAARYAVPTMYHFREFTAAGGLSGRRSWGAICARKCLTLVSFRTNHSNLTDDDLARSIAPYRLECELERVRGGIVDAPLAAEVDDPELHAGIAPNLLGDRHFQL